MKDRNNYKNDHIKITIEEDVSSKISNGLENFRFIHHGLPECDVSSIDISTKFLSIPLSMPLMISCMTGGPELAKKINENLAIAAEDCGIIMGLGSMRILLEDESKIDSFNMKNIAPNLKMFANIGAAQLKEYDLLTFPKIVDKLQADGLVVHLNPLQEFLQSHGSCDWKGVLHKIGLLAKILPVPLIVKEVGYGISKDVAKELINCEISAIDIAGAGGTSWSKVEMMVENNCQRKEIAQPFDAWGISTIDSLHNVKSINDNFPIIASGGINNGMDGAKVLALGSNLFSMSVKFLKASLKSCEEVCKAINIVKEQLIGVMFCTRCEKIVDLNADLLKKV